MPNELTQANREIAIATALGEDILVLLSFSARQELGRPFVIDVEMLSTDHQLKPDAILGTNATIRVEDSSKDVTRYLNGDWDRFEYRGTQGAYAKYTGRLVPWLDFLRHTTDCRIFQEMTALDIIKEVFRDFALGEFEESVTGNYRTRDYCVQYRESSFDFVSRLMEEEGIYYHFKHEDGKHIMVLLDDSGSHTTHPDYPELIYTDESNPTRDRIDGVKGWVASQQVATGDVELRDYDYLKPANAVEGVDQIVRDHERADFQRYDYPGVFKESNDGGKLATVRLQAIQSKHLICQATTTSCNVEAGSTFTLLEHPRDQFNEQDFLVTAVTLNATSDGFQSGDVNVAIKFESVLTAIPVAEQFRTPLATHRPLIHGPQTAVVVGPAGEELHLDEHGRVKLKFHWDRYAQADDTASCWVRVSQGFAGKGWGGAFHPRIGQEVIVDFEDGNPDRPIITGRVYNGNNGFPYDPTSFGTISTIKTNSSKGGGGFNELRFEDKKGEEQIYIHAQKNMDILVLNDRFEKVDNDRHLTVGNDKREKVMNNRHEIVEASHQEHIKKDRNVKIDGKEALEVGSSRSITVTKDVNQDFKKNYLTKVKNIAYTKGKIIAHKASFNFTAKVGGNFIAITPAGIKMKGKAIQIEASSKGIDMKAKKDVKVDTKGGFEVKALKDVKMAATGNGEIKTTGNMDIKSTGNTNIKATGMANFKGTAPSEVSSAAILTVKGALVKIN
jgi:type VI secretion system secreted protein VgrG